MTCRSCGRDTQIAQVGVGREIRKPIGPVDPGLQHFDGTCTQKGCGAPYWQHGARIDPAKWRMKEGINDCDCGSVGA
jgi:hypothetical protein